MGKRLNIRQRDKSHEITDRLFCSNPSRLYAGAGQKMMAMHPEIRLGIGERPGVMFAMLHNKGAATRLVSAASPAFARIERHASHNAKWHDAHGESR